MQKQHGSANSDTKLTERRNVEGEYKHSSIQKVQNKEYLIKNACYSVTKYYLCKRNNKRSLLGRKQRSQVARSFPNRYQFSCTNKVTSLFSIRYILIIILQRYFYSLYYLYCLFYEHFMRVSLHKYPINGRKSFTTKKLRLHTNLAFICE